MATMLSSPGSWNCPRCNNINPFCENCKSCKCPHPKQPCSQCTFINTYDAEQCAICNMEFEITKEIISKLNKSGPSIPNIPAIPPLIGLSQSPNDDILSGNPAQDFAASINRHKMRDDHKHKAEEEEEEEDEDEEDDDDMMFDLTQYDDSQSNNNENIRNKRSEPPQLEASGTETSQDMKYENDMNDDDGNDDELQKILALSQIQYSEEQKQRRLSNQYNEDDQIKKAMEESRKTQKKEQNHRRLSNQWNDEDMDNNLNNDGIFGGYDDLFGAYCNNLSDSNINNDDIEIHEINDTANCNGNARKRKRDRENNNIQSPTKKRKIDDVNKPKKKRAPRKRKKKKKNDDDINGSDPIPPNIGSINLNNNNNKEENDDDIDIKDTENDNNSASFQYVDPETLPTKHRKKIENAFQKFLKAYLKGSFSLRTVCIEYGPRFKGRSKAFDNILSDTKWRPKSMDKNGLPQEVAFNACDNEELPVFVTRFKHYKLKCHQKQLIYGGADKEEEINKLKGLNNKGMPQYFLPRLLDKTDAIYEKYTVIRLDWKNFEQIWCKKSNFYDSFDALIGELKRLQNVGTINIMLEGVTQKINQLEQKRLNGGNNNNNNNNNDKNGDCPFKDAQQLKDRMMSYYLRDKCLHFTYTKNQKETAEYIIRAARALAENRFKKLRVNSLNISDQNSKNFQIDKRATDEDIFLRSLVTIHNLSARKAAGIITRYKSIGALMDEYSKLNASDGALLLKDIIVPGSTGKIGPAISKKVYDTFWVNQDGDKMMNT